MTIQTFVKLGLDRDLPQLLTMEGHTILNIGAGNKLIEGTIALDRPWNAESDPIPFANGTVSGIHCYHFLEHISNLVFVLSEFERVLKIGGVANIVTPYYNSQCQSQDIDHKRSFCEETWRNLFQNSYYDRGEWKLAIHCCFIFGLVERNLCLFTQLVKIR